MGDEGYQEDRFIHYTKKKKDESKLKRFLNPVKGLLSWEIKDKKKDRLTA